MPDQNDATKVDPLTGAAGAIGPSHPTDYVVDPTGHAERYRDAAPDLATVLSRSSVRVVAERYQKLDSLALEHQRRFKATSSRARSAVFWAGVTAAFLLVTGSLSGLLSASLRTPLMVVAAGGAVVAGALATMWIRQIKEGRLLERWMTSRAEAETARLQYFERVTRDPEPAEPLLQLEYFRRYQLDVQRAFYAERGGDHRRAADRSLSLSSMALAGGAGATGLAGVLGALDPAWSALAGLGLVGQAWAARIVNEEATAQDRRNAERYGRTHLALDRIYERLDDVRRAAADGRREVMREFVDAVHEQLSLEHRQWLEEIDAAGSAIERLEALLAQYRESKQPDTERVTPSGG